MATAVTKTDDQNNSLHTAIYESKIFASRDSSYYKSLLEVTVTHDPLPANATVRLLFAIDNFIGLAWGRIFSNTTNNSLGHTAKRIEETSDTITVTIASPAVVTLTNHDLLPGQEIVFTTTGALPTGITSGTIYYVISAGLALNTFRFSATAPTSSAEGSAVNTTGTQSGTHTLSRTALLPTKYKEIQFRIESSAATSGRAGQITSLSFKESILNRQYDTA